MMFRLIKIIFVVIILLNASIVFSANDNIYLDCDAVVNGNGQVGTPYNDMSDAVGDLTDGDTDTLHIKGTCDNEAMTIGISGQDSTNHLTIQNWSGSNAILDGSGLDETSGITITGGKKYITIQASNGDFTIQNFDHKGINCVASSGSESEYIYVDGLIFNGNGTDAGEYNATINFEYVDFGKIENIQIVTANYAGIRLVNCDGNAGTHWVIDNVNMDGLTERAESSTNYCIFGNTVTYADVTKSDIDITINAGEDKRGIFFIDSSNILIGGTEANANNVLASAIVNGGNSIGIGAANLIDSTISYNVVGKWGEDCYEVNLDQVGDKAYNVIITNNLGYNCYANVFEMADDIGWDGAAASAVIIRNNVAYLTDSNVASNASCFGWHKGGGSNVAVVEWYNNTAYTTLTGRYAFWIGKSADSEGFNDLKVINNIGMTLDKYCLAFQGDDVTPAIDDGDVKYNSWYRSDSGDIIWWRNSLENDGYTSAEVVNGDAYTDHDIEPSANFVAGLPSFVNPPSDLSLQSGDNRIDSGFDLSGTFTDDKDGNTRIAPWDIGAYEYQGDTTSDNRGLTNNGGLNIE